MSVAGGRPDVARRWLELLLLAITGLTPLGGFLQDQLVQRQIGDGASQPQVLPLDPEPRFPEWIAEDVID